MHLTLYIKESAILVNKPQMLSACTSLPKPLLKTKHLQKHRITTSQKKNNTNEVHVCMYVNLYLLTLAVSPKHVVGFHKGRQAISQERKKKK